MRLRRSRHHRVPRRKSPHELELLRLACEATCDVYRHGLRNLNDGISQDEINSLIEAGFTKMGLKGGALVLIGASAALPARDYQTRHAQRK